VIPARFLKATSFRLAFLYMTLFGISALALLGLIYEMTSGFMKRQTDETIEAEVQGLAEQYSQLGLSGLLRVVNARAAGDDLGESLYLLTDPDLRPLAGNISRWPGSARDSALAEPPEGGGDGWLDIKVQDKGKSTFARVRRFILPGDFRLLVGREISERVRIERLIERSLAWGLVATLALGFGGGILMSRGMRRRLDGINRAVEEIMRLGPARRMPVSELGDEFDQLAANLNAMLDQIQSLMDAVRDVGDNIAHDLRTPLTRLRAKLEMTLDHGDGPCRAALEEALGETDKLLATFAALLTIAQVEAGSQLENFEAADLARIAADALELYEPLAEEKGLRLTMEPGAFVPVLGNRGLIAQAAANLIDNAVKYTPAGGTISLSVRRDGGRAVLRVADSGPGIPPEAREKVLERFARLDASRATPGSGLGLSLVAAVAKRHGASLTLGDNHPGLAVELTFPTAA
jgi:signal transduction histidine kinase